MRPEREVKKKKILWENKNKGVKNGMWVGSAKKLCPDLMIVPYQFDKYEEVKKKIFCKKCLKIFFADFFSSVLHFIQIFFENSSCQL
jgi:hypothetical protein